MATPPSGSVPCRNNRHKKTIWLEQRIKRNSIGGAACRGTERHETTGYYSDFAGAAVSSCKKRPQSLYLGRIYLEFVYGANLLGISDGGVLGALKGFKVAAPLWHSSLGWRNYILREFRGERARTHDIQTAIEPRATQFTAARK